MRSQLEACGPDDLKVLEQILDSVWLELQKKGLVAPHDAVNRQLVAANVFSCAKDDGLDLEKIKRSVLERWMKSPPRLARGDGKLKSAT